MPEINVHDPDSYEEALAAAINSVADVNTVNNAEKSAVENLPGDTVQAIADEAAARNTAVASLQSQIDTLSALSHPLGTYADEAVLIAAHPTANAGEYAINLDTDTIWIWDADLGTPAWVDSGSSGTFNGTSDDVPEGALNLFMTSIERAMLGQHVYFNGDGSNTVDVSAELQAAVNQAKLLNLPLLIAKPTVAYRVDSPIYLTGDASGFESLTIIGEGKTYEARPGAPTAKVLIDHSANKTAACVFIDKARSVRIKGLAFKGPNNAPETGEATRIYPDETGWVDGDVRDERYSPQCAIAIDCLIGSSDTPDGGYPGVSYVDHSVSAGSHDVLIDDCAFFNQNIIGAHGLHTSAANGDVVEWRNINAEYFQFAFAYGQSQNRANRIVGGNFAYGRALATGVRYGNQQGSMPDFINKPQVGYVNRIIEFAHTFGVGRLDVYAESVHTIGYWGVGSSSARFPIFLNGSFFLRSGDGKFKKPGFVFTSFGPAFLQGATIKNNVEFDPVLNICAPGTPIILDGTVIELTNDARRFLGVASLGSRAKMSARGAQARSPASTIDLDDNAIYDVLPARLEILTGNPIRVRTPDKEYQVKPSQGNNTFGLPTKTGIIWNANDAVLQCDSAPASYIIVGDVVSASLNPMDGAAVGVVAPAFRITDITGNDITCEYLVDPEFIDQSVTEANNWATRGFYHSWAPGLGLTGDTTSGSDQITNLSRNDVLKIGDWVRGSGIPNNTRIIAIDTGTDSATLSVNATATAAAVDLYDSQLVEI